VPHCQMLYPMP